MGSSTNLVGSDVRFAVATPADDAAIRRLLRENPMRGFISLTFEREPNYFRGAGIGGADDKTIVAFENDRLICMGRCTTRACWINGKVIRVGYLGELRLDHRAHGRFSVLRDGYRFFHELNQLNSVELHFTSIAADNQRARLLLERGLPGLPRYEFLAGLTTLLVSTRSNFMRSGRRPCLPGSEVGRQGRLPLRKATLESASPAELADFLNRCGSQRQFATAWTTDAISSLATHDLPLASFGVLRQRGEIVAAAGLWDQRRFRQTVIRDYSRPLALARPLLNTFAPIFGRPSLPARGSVLSHAFLSPLAVAPPHEKRFADLVVAFQARAAQHGIDFITLALPSNDTRLAPLLAPFRSRTYVSRLYRVSWPGERTLMLDARPVLPDVSLL